MDSEDLAELKFAEEMNKPVCTCGCHQGDGTMHCVPCCGEGPGHICRPPDVFSAENELSRVRALLGDAYIQIEDYKRKVAKLERQAADGWTHPDEVAAKVRSQEATIAALRKSLAGALSVVLENTLEYINEDPSGERLEQMRPELERIRDLLKPR